MHGTFESMSCWGCTPPISGRSLNPDLYFHILTPETLQETSTPNSTLADTNMAPAPIIPIALESLGAIRVEGRIPGIIIRQSRP